MFRSMDRINVICIMILVNRRVSMRYAVDNNNAAATTSNSRYTVLLHACHSLSEEDIREGRHQQTGSE